MKADALVSTGIFRRERLDEPLELYTEYFELFEKVFASTIDQLEWLAAEPFWPKRLIPLVTGKNQKKAFRYLTAPPISEDDLKALAEANFGPLVLKRDPAAAKRIRDTVLTVLDRHRFPWIGELRSPTEHERMSAIGASAALAAAREVETKRRGTSKEVQEKAVKAALIAEGFKEVSRRPIPMLTTAPAPGEFCGESEIAGTRADVVVRLHDGRVLAIECKVSNSGVNSYKRLIHEAAGKATTWYGKLGTAQIVAGAVLSGVFTTANLQKAQNETSVFLFWTHRLSDLADFVRDSK